MDMFQHEFEKEKLKEAPLAARMRPKTLEEFVGQQHIVGKGKVLRLAIESGNLPSIMLWGPPGSGKTTLANIIANSTSSHFSPISAVSAGVADLRKTIEEAKERRLMTRKKTILFIDEIHRFNKAQQDAILPFVEDGTITLIGATTENPSFEVISPLLSRSQLYVLKPLTKEEIKLIILRAIKDTLRGLGVYKVELEDDALDYLITMCNNDARAALNTLETAALITSPDADGKR
ncbi:MAG: AAA family ATPase, partial [Dehalococcoidales bacterium]